MAKRQKGTEGLADVGPGLLEDGPVTIARTALGSPFFKPSIAPRSFDRLSDEGQEMVAGLQQIAAQIHEMQGHLESHVYEARALGASWDLIGWSVGTTGSAARQRWGDEE